MLRIPAALVLLIAVALGFSSCGQESNMKAANLAPPNEVDGMINDYEQVTNEYVRVAKKHKQGDLSITIRVIELGKRTRESAAKLQQESAKMTPPQVQRVSQISSRAAPYLQN